MDWILSGKAPYGMGDIVPMLTVVGRSWDEKQVTSWLHTINCGQYESLFKGDT